MTRINTILPADLTDQHLHAEYRELPRILPLARAAVARGRLNVPDSYRLGAGHVRFFYPRTHWLVQRHRAIVAEMLSRGMTVNYPDPLVPVDAQQAPWEPSAADVALSLSRLRQRLLSPPRPGFYTYGGEPVGDDFYGAPLALEAA